MPTSLLQDEWIVANEEDGCNTWGLSLFPYVFAYGTAKYSRTEPFYCAMDFKEGHIRLLVPSHHWAKQGEIIFSRVLRNPVYFKTVKKELEWSAKKLYQFSNAILNTDMRKMNHPGASSEVSTADCIRTA